MPIIKVLDPDTGNYYTIPALRGPKGDTGAPGIKGDKGDPGDTTVVYPTDTMKASVYDPTNKAQDVFAYADSVASSKPKLITLSLPASWTGASEPYTQNFTISSYTVTEHSRVDLAVTAETIQALEIVGVRSIVIVNDACTLTAYLLGEKPTTTITLQATISEVT